MIIDMRYVIRHEKETIKVNLGGGSRVPQEITKRVKVLQMLRRHHGMGEDFITEVIQEWVDVPTVEEDNGGG